MGPKPTPQAPALEAKSQDRDQIYTTEIECGMQRI